MQLYTYPCEILRVVDGDTVDGLIDLGFEILHKRRIRLDGINTPESRGITRPLGKEAADHLSKLIGDAEIRLESHEVGKYGRVLGTLHRVDGPNHYTNLNQQMIDDGHALPYHGEARSDADFLTPDFLRGRPDPRNAAA